MLFKHEETNIQVTVVNYIRLKYPLVLFTIAPSGMKLPIYVARMLKAMGYRAGTPDIMIFEPRRGHHGLFIEMKTKDGVVSELQERFIGLLNSKNYKAVICFSYEEAVKVLDWYFEGDYRKGLNESRNFKNESSAALAAKEA